jgi:hypothetical protein
LYRRRCRTVGGCSRNQTAGLGLESVDGATTRKTLARESLRRDATL